MFLVLRPVTAIRRTAIMGRAFHRFHTTSSHRSTTASPAPPAKSQLKPFPVGTALVGQSSKSYQIEEILSTRERPFICVYKARCEETHFVLKNACHVLKDIEESREVYEYHEEMQNTLAPSPFLRTYVDTIPAHLLLVYPFMSTDLLKLAYKPMSDETRKVILKSALTGLAKLHDHYIYHGDIKPDNILADVDVLPSGDDVSLRCVRVADLEDAVNLEGKVFEGVTSGNQIWRSPEAWASAKQQTPSDIYSFAVVAVWVMRRQMLFCVEPEDRTANADEGEEAWWSILRRHVSYFADQDGFLGLLELLGEDNIYHQRLLQIFVDLTDKDDPTTWRRPFERWPGVDPVFRDLVTKMTNFDPKRRITAREALQHPFFKDVKTVPETWEDTSVPKPQEDTDVA